MPHHNYHFGYDGGCDAIVGTSMVIVVCCCLVPTIHGTGIVQWDGGDGCDGDDSGVGFDWNSIQKYLMKSMQQQQQPQSMWWVVSPMWAKKMTKIHAVTK